nr:MAG TPA: hypothetical protein [Caudoviricetes sp.]
MRIHIFCLLYLLNCYQPVTNGDKIKRKTV